ncbi:MAG: glycosyltransferase family 4 protein [Candidatus Zixiibacteriota bacterium]
MMQDRQLRILYISHYFPPEVNAPAVRVSQLSKHWIKLGHKVTVVTGFPNHPHGVIPEEYRGKIFSREMQDGLSILRSYVYAAPNKGFARRILNYLSFMMSGMISAIFRSGAQDVVIATSPQFFVAIAGYVVSVFKNARFVFEVRDVWPEEIVAVGAMKRGFVIKMLERIEMFLYRRASLIVAVAQGTIDILTERGIDPGKIVLVPNGVDYDKFCAAVDDHAIRDQHNLNGRFLVSYIGTHGMAHNLGTVLKAANRLRGREDIRFLFVGDGADKANLVADSNALGLDNVTFVPQQSRNRIADYYAASDLCLVPLRQADLFTKNIPSKIYEVMASGKPILIGAKGESRRLVESAQAGIAVEPDDDRDLSEKIERLADDRGLSERLGKNGREFARQNCTHRDLAAKYIDHLRKCVATE